MKSIKLRNKNAILELLQEEGLEFEKITLLAQASKDDRTREILELANKKSIKVEKMTYQRMDKRRQRESKETLVAHLKEPKTFSFEEVLDMTYEKDEFPFFILINRVDYANNIALIARTAFASGVNGIIFQTDKDRIINEETLHLSMGAIARIPLIKMGIFDAIKELKRNGIRVYALDMNGKAYFKETLKGAVAFVLGAEGEGVSDTVTKQTDQVLSIPMKKGIDSLNVGASASVLMYEKVRQEMS